MLAAVHTCAHSYVPWSLCVYAGISALEGSTIAHGLRLAFRRMNQPWQFQKTRVFEVVPVVELP